jgi:hypothetical protein
LILPDDNYDLVVVPPDSESISTWHSIDAFSGGVFEDDRNEAIKAQTFHTESVYFPSVSPSVEYVFFVETDVRVFKKVR